MAQQTINRGTTVNDGTGDSFRTAAGKINDNFTELYTGRRTTESTAARTLSISDSGLLIICTHASGCSVTVPSGLGATFWCEFLAAGGDSIFFFESGAFIRSVYGGMEVSRYGLARLTAGEANVLYLTGDVELPSSQMARNILITRRNWAEDPAASFSDDVGNWPLPLSNMLDLRPQVVAEAADVQDWSSTMFEMDLGYARKVGMIWFANLRTSPLGIIIIKAGIDSAFEYNEYETTTTSWPGADGDPLGENPWGEIAMTHTVMRDEYEKMGFSRFFIPPAVIDCRYIRVEIRDSTNSSPLKIGCFGASEVWEPPINFDYGWQITTLDESDVMRVPHGSTHVDERGTRRRLNLGFSQHSETETWDRAFGIPLIRGRSKPLVAVPFPDDTYNHEKNGVYGTIGADSQLSNPLIARFAQTFQIDQLI